MCNFYSCIAFELPIRTISLTNARGHWAKRHALRQQQRQVAYAMTCSKTFRKERTLPATITLTRIAPRRLDDDNCVSALKSVRDGIADAFDRDDGDDGFTWRYDQENRSDYAVRVKIETNGASE